MHETTDLDSLATELSSRLLRDGGWSVTTEELESLVDPVTLYRAVYELKQIGRDAYTPETAGELVSLLERAGFTGAEQELRRAGLFLGHDDRLDLTERFVRRLRHAIVVHLPDPEIFRGMLRQFRNYDIAEETYCATYLDSAPVIEAIAGEYAEDRAGSAAAHTATAAWYLHTLVDRRIVVVQDLGPALFELLRTVARQEGRLPPLGEGRRAGGARGTRYNGQAGETSAGRKAAALKTLGLTGSSVSRREVQARYRSLMRRYHPDVNPDGLEMSKKINSAYGLLVSDVGEGAQQ